ncbi:DUF3857 domain-containing protein [Shewanella sp.]|uniref:DUF3857 domain-containing protein n=1 Tax=Shewanella sp. TaxID=50422 RepID=UPI0035681876
MNRLSHCLLLASVYMLFGVALCQAKTISSGEYSIELTTAPDWVKPETLQPMPTQRETSPIHYRMVSRQVLVTAEADHYFMDHAAYANNHQGVKELSKLELTFNPAFEKPQIHSIQVERNGQLSDRLESSRINLINQEPELVNDLFHGLVTAVVIIPDLRVGDTVRYQYSLHGRNPVYGSQFGAYFAMGWDAGIDLLSLRLINGRSLPLKLELKDAPEAIVSNGKLGTEYLWRQTSVPRYHHEEGTPADVDWAPYIAHSSSENWAEVADWARGLYQGDQKISEDLATYVKRLKAMADKEQQIAEIVRFVQQDIRYFGIEMGQSSHVPHTPNQVFERRYGDCKDKANLMNFLLSQVKVTSHAALVNTSHGRALPERQPSVVLFDHVINLVEYKGQSYWIDGTNHVQAQGLQQLTQPDFGYALVLRPNEQGLTPMPESPPASDNIDVEQSLISSGYMNPVDMYVVSRYRGKEADRMRYQLQGVSAFDVEQHYLNYYAKLYPGIRLQEPVFIQDSRDGRNEILLRERYQIDNFWAVQGNTANFNLFAYKLSDYIQLPSVIQRSKPMAIAGPITVNHTITLDFPELVNVPSAENDVVINTPTLTYRSSELGRPGKLIRRHTLELKQDRIPANESAQFFDALKKIDRDIYYTGSISGEIAQPLNPGVDYLEQHLNTGNK